MVGLKLSISYSFKIIIEQQKWSIHPLGILQPTKTNLTATLVHRALMICTKNKLKQQIDFIKRRRWSRIHKARGQGHKKIRGQGQPFRGQTLSRPRTQPQAFYKNRIKGLQKSFSGNLQFIGEAKIFDWGGLNHKSHAMTSSKICLLALNQDFAK